MANKSKSEYRAIAILAIVMILLIIAAGVLHDQGWQGSSTSCVTLAALCALLLSGLSKSD